MGAVCSHIEIPWCEAMLFRSDYQKVVKGLIGAAETLFAVAVERSSDSVIWIVSDSDSRAPWCWRELFVSDFSFAFAKQMFLFSCL